MTLVPGPARVTERAWRALAQGGGALAAPGAQTRGDRRTEADVRFPALARPGHHSPSGTPGSPLPPALN